MLSAKKNKKTQSLVGVDIDAAGVNAAEIGDGVAGLRTASAPLAAGVVDRGEVVDQAAVAEALRSAFTQAKLPKRVRLSLASQSVAFRMIRLPLIEDQEQLKAAVRFQAQEQIPMPLDSAFLDHQVIGARIEDDGSRQLDVAVVAARRHSVEVLLETARGAGLEPVGIDLSAFGMIRALAGGSAQPVADPNESGQEGEAFVPAVLYASLGGVTNLAIARDFACLFSRVAQFSVRDIAVELSAATGLSVEHAEAWMIYVGLYRPLDEIEGDPATIAAVRGALEGSLSRLADELRLSLDYYGAQDGAAPVGDVVLAGWGSAIPGLGDAISTQLGRAVKVGRPDALSSMADDAAARLTLSYGLALEH